MTEDTHAERWELLQQIDEIAEKPLIALSFVWLVLLIIDLTAGLSPLLNNLVYAIWALFILDFVVEIIIAPDYGRYLRRNWLTGLALLLPALRLLRLFRAVRVLRAARGLRSVNFVRVLTSINRGMRAVSKSLGRRGVSYVIALTLVVTFGGAAGMYFFEGPPAAALDGAAAVEAGFADYADALWWTAMLLTSIGSEYWPVTAEGRLLTLLLALYGLAILGYIAGIVASFFIGAAGAPGQPPAPAAKQTAEVERLQEEIAALRRQLAAARRDEG